MAEDRAERIAELREKVDAEELAEEQRQIEQSYLSTRFAQKFRHVTLSCFQACGGEMEFPY